MKKEARLSARALAEVEVGRGEEDLRCKSLFIVCQRRRGSSEDEETIGVMVYGCKNQIMVAVTKRFESGPIKSRVGAFPDVFSVINISIMAYTYCCC